MYGHEFLHVAEVRKNKVGGFIDPEVKYHVSMVSGYRFFGSVFFVL
jgi:hypothetical protein